MVTSGIMRFLVFVALILSFSGGWPLPSQARETTVFISVLEDVPVMPLLAEAEHKALLFDAPSGRVAETLLAGPAMPQAVFDYYNKVLPQLGWHPLKTENEFARSGEVLQIERLNIPMEADAARLFLYRLKVAPAIK